MEPPTIRPSSSRSTHDIPGPAWPPDPVGRAATAASAFALLAGFESARLVRALAGGPSLDASTEDLWCAWHDRQRWPSRPLRVGLIDAADWARPVVAERGSCDVEWFDVQQAGSARALCRRFHLDAVVRAVSGRGVEIITNVAGQREGSWPDWSVPRPLSYASVFPARMDPHRVTLDADTGRATAPELLRAIVECAAAFTRTPARLGLRERVFGRRPAEWTVPATAALGKALEASALSTLPTHAERTAGRVLSAWASTWNGDADEVTRRDWAEAAALRTDDEPESLLRLAAVRLAGQDDGAGLEAIERVDSMLRDQQLPVSGDTTLFIQSELEHGNGNGLAAGRIGAGVCLAAAGMTRDELLYFRDDLMEDLRFSTAFIGRDQDRRVLAEVFRSLERARFSEWIAAWKEETPDPAEALARETKPTKQGRTGGRTAPRSRRNKRSA